MAELEVAESVRNFWIVLAAGVAEQCLDKLFGLAVWLLLRHLDYTAVEFHSGVWRARLKQHFLRVANFKYRFELGAGAWLDFLLHCVFVVVARHNDQARVCEIDSRSFVQIAFNDAVDSAFRLLNCKPPVLPLRFEVVSAVGGVRVVAWRRGGRFRPALRQQVLNASESLLGLPAAPGVGQRVAPFLDDGLESDLACSCRSNLLVNSEKTSLQL